MKGFDLPSHQTAELRAAHRSAKRAGEVKQAYKINAIILLGNGWTLEEVAEALLLDSETLRAWAKAYQDKGVEGLFKTFHSGREGKLSDDQLNELKHELDSEIYLSTQAVCHHVEKTYGVTYSLSGMRDLLHRLNYVYKKPKLVPGNPDVEAQEIWVQQFLDFMENKAENEAVVFMDAVHPVHNTLAGYGWIRKGEERTLKTNSGRGRLNIHGAMNAETLETTVIMGEASVNADSTVELLAYLETIYPLAAVIYVILDNARYHFSPAVQEWVKHSRIKLIPLPPYSPELNLIERLWRVFKKKVMYNTYYETYEAFQQACVDFFKNQQAHYEDIQSIMGDGLQDLAFYDG